MENALFYPFYVLKTREQADVRTLAGKSPWAQSQAHLRTLLAEQGVRGMYRGFVSSNLTAFPAYAVYMGVYTWAKDELGYKVGESENRGLSSLYAPFLAGLLADGASVALYVPGDVIVQRLQLKDSPYKSFWDACRQIYRTDGMQGFFRGIGATFVTSGVASAVWWVIYENVKNQMYVSIEKKKKLKSLEDQANSASTAVTASSLSSSASSSTSPPSASSTLWHQLTGVNRVPQVLAGFIAGTFTSVLINPLDVVKTRLQVQDAHTTTTNGTSAASSTNVANKRYKNMLHGLLQIYRDDGLRGYTRGVMPKLISRGPLSAMSSLLYEVVMHLSRYEEPTGNEHKFQ